MSPQNVLLGADGIPRVLDFGIAKASGRLTTTRGAELKGKLSYMAPEQFLNEPLSRKADIFAASVVLWEALTGKRLYPTESEASTVHAVLLGSVAPPSSERPDLPAGLDEVVLRGLERTPDARYESARAMALALEQCMPLASMEELGEWVREVAEESLAARAAMIAAIESVGDVTALAPDASFPSLPSVVEGETTAATIASGVASRTLARPHRSFPWWGLVAIGAASGAIGVSALLGAARRGESGPAVSAPPGSAAAPIVTESAAVEPGATSSAFPEVASAATLSSGPTPTSSAPPPPPAAEPTAHRQPRVRSPATEPATAHHGLPPGLPDQRE